MKRCLAILLVLLLLLSPALAADETGEEGGDPVAAETGSPTSGENGSEGEEPAPEAEEPGADKEGTEPEEPENLYVPGQFSDVEEDRWYGAEGQGTVRLVWELGLMEGMGDGTFRPLEPLRLSEAVKLAAVLHSHALGDEAEFASTRPWYGSYADYAEAEGILQSGEFADLNAYATRGEMAHILAAALPEAELEHINAIFAIPDVSSLEAGSVPYGADILRLYRAGVLLGDSGSHCFRPEDTITRVEAAAAVVRLALKEERQRLELLPLNGASAPIPEAVLLREDGASLCLGYHPWEEFFAFVGADTPREAADLFLSLDLDESLGYPIYGEEGSRILAEYPRFTLEYLIADRDPQGMYILRLECRDPDMQDNRGIRVGMTLRSLLQAFPDPKLARESGSSDPVWFSCTLEDPAVEYRYAVGWDGRVTGFSVACVGAAEES